MQDDCRIFGNGKSSKTTNKNQHHKFPSGLGPPSRRRRTKENLTHFFGHYHRILDDVANDIIAEMEQNVTAPVKKGPFYV